jgi:Holliday junction resolvase RusA-like endonuclease
VTPLLGPVFVRGKPLPKGSLKTVRRGEKTVWVNDNPDLDGWEECIADTIGWKAGHLRRDPITAPVDLEVTFHLPRSATTKFPTAPIGHGMGDLDKLIRAIGDGLTRAGVWKDDALVARITAEKIYTLDRPGVTVTLWPYQPAPVSGRVPVRLYVGRAGGRLGAVADMSEVPSLLRAAADRLEGVSRL